MKCHVLHARGSYAAAGSGMKPSGCRSPLPDWLPSAALRVKPGRGPSRGETASLPQPLGARKRRQGPSRRQDGTPPPQESPLPPGEGWVRGRLRASESGERSPAEACRPVPAFWRTAGTAASWAGGGRLRSSSLLPRRGAGPFSARILRGRRTARLRLSAPARFAHLIARARQRAHLSRRLLTGFQKSAPPRPRNAGGSGSGFRFPGDHHTTIRQMSSPYREQKSKIPEIFLNASGSRALPATSARAESDRFETGGRPFDRLRTSPSIRARWRGRYSG